MRILISTLAIAGAIALSVGCKSDSNIITQPTPVNIGGPDIIVAPVALTFGTLMSTESEIQVFTIESVGDQPLTIEDITVDNPAYTILSVTNYELAPEELVEIEVEFTPMGVENAGIAIVHSDDPDEPESQVLLNGGGTVPELTITPNPHDFGTRFIPCPDTVSLTLENTGDDVLTIDEIGHVSAEDFALYDDNVLPLVLNPGENTTVDVTYIPTIEGTTSGELQVLSNDPRGLVTAEQSGTAQYAGFNTDTHTVPTDPPVDILFAVDQSCSMDSIAGQVGSNFNTFINQIDAATNGWRIGVANIGTLGQPNGNAGCFISGAIENTTPNYQSVFSNDVTYGSDSSGSGTYSERLTQLVDIALSKTTPGGCNSGFLRPGALLHVVMVTDEYNHAPEPWTYYLGNYQTYVSDPTLLKVSGVLATGSGNCGGGGGAAGYTDIVAATGGETINICNNNWAAELDNLGAASLNGVSNFELNNPADGSSIQVQVNGTPRSDWVYDQNANEVQFNSPLNGGDQVVIEYGIAVGCSN